ncbi:YegP family protein [Enterococcus faecalis]|uniref:YegP family protein n=1 Tax=Enterococcus faecalis TaxID=1351 RepID=UPI004043354D
MPFSGIIYLPKLGGMLMYFVIKKSSDEKYYFLIKTSDNVVLVSSKTYYYKASVIDIIESIRSSIDSKTIIVDTTYSL